MIKNNQSFVFFISLVVILAILTITVFNVQKSTDYQSRASAKVVGKSQTNEGTLIKTFVYDDTEPNGEKIQNILNTNSKILTVSDDSKKLKSARTGTKLKLNGFQNKDEVTLLNTSTVSNLSDPNNPVPTGSVVKKVLVLNFTQNDVSNLQNQFISEVNKYSQSNLNYQIIDTKVASSSTKKIDYTKLISDYKLCDQVTSGAIDEVWLWANSNAGLYQYYNSIGTNLCSKPVPIMGFNSTTNNTNSMLRALAHRVDKPNNNCNSVDTAPNSTINSDYTSTTIVNSSCNPENIDKPLNCNAWGCTDFEKYWLSSVSDWWSYIL